MKLIKLFPRQIFSEEKPKEEKENAPVKEKAHAKERGKEILQCFI